MGRKSLFLLLPLVFNCLVITGCDQKQTPVKTSLSVVKKYVQSTTLEGQISNNKGVIKSGSLEVSDENGHSITHVQVIDGHYSVEIPANTVLPILLTFTAETGGEQLVAVAIHESLTKYEINTSTTAIAKAAKAMGGYTHANMVRAAENTVHTPDANKTSAGWRGDPTTQYGGWH